jgi:hypothetical protein
MARVVFRPARALTSLANKNGYISQRHVFLTTGSVYRHISIRLGSDIPNRNISHHFLK